MTLTERQWQTILAVCAAVVAFLLMQPLVQQYPVLMLVLGAFNVGLAVLSPTRLAYDITEPPAGDH